ncbi:MAG: DUF4179 domain-containing protein, partial [Pseudoflavonifractor sp.]|nr:DUF4179 domain-containing protein [Pseudoflavonifractor sp.]
MERREEYERLLSAWEETPLPPALDGCVDGARRKARRRRLIQDWGAALASLGGVAAAFALAVNLSLPFALACGRIPILKEMAAAVALSSSLKAAVENDYVQPVGQSQTVNGLTMTVDYLILDKKQVNIFYHFTGDFSSLSGSPELQNLEGDHLSCSYSGDGLVGAPGEIHHVSASFGDGGELSETPPALCFLYRIEHLENRTEQESQPAAPIEEYDPWEKHTAPEALFTFSFDLELNEEYRTQGLSYDLNQWVELDGQRILLKTVEIYPTNLRVELEGDPENTSWLKSLDFYIEDENGRRNDPITNGITASGTTGSPAMGAFYQESSFFWNSRHLTLHITGGQWLDKDQRFVTVDLDTGTTEDPLPDGILLGGAVRQGTNTAVVLYGRTLEGDSDTNLYSYQLANWS